MAHRQGVRLRRRGAYLSRNFAPAAFFFLFININNAFVDHFSSCFPPLSHFRRSEKMESTSPEPKSRSEKTATVLPEQQLPDRSSADKRSRTSSNTAEPVDPTDSPSVPATRQQPARSAKSSKSDTGDEAKLIVLSDDEVKIGKKREPSMPSVAARGERRSPFCSTCVKQCLKGKGTTCYNRLGSRSDRCWNCSTHTCIQLNADLWAQFKMVYKEVSD
jgi:hypothetical protein